MPELPEVETIRNRLRFGSPEQAPITGLIIQRAEVLWSKTLAVPARQEFEAKIANQEIHDIGRRGKYLLFYLSNYTLLIHLRMSGDIIVDSDDSPLAKHDRLVLHLNKERRMAFNDSRKFGRAWLVSDPDEILARLGPEPLDRNLGPQDFYQRLQAFRRQIKPLLLDQSFLAGVGNIYADEALHLARIHPLSTSNELSLEQAERLLEAIRNVLEEGILRNGASIDWVYRGGDFQNYFRAYARAGEPCQVCGNMIIKIKVGQRGTYFCPACQPA